MCDFNTGFREPEMVKRRPVFVLSPKITARINLCTIIALSTTPPEPIMPYHAIIKLPDNFPEWLREKQMWLKGDMIYTASFMRLDFIKSDKAKSGKRIYIYKPLDCETIKTVEKCVLNGIGLAGLTKYL